MRGKWFDERAMTVLDRARGARETAFYQDITANRARQKAPAKKVA
jgi:hypothetical protein